MAGNICQKVSKCLKTPVKGLLLDITGVLYESGSKKAIEGSIDAIKRLRSLGIPFRFVTNESQKTKKSLVVKLQSFGFSLSENEVFSPAPVVAKILKEKCLRPFLLVHPELLPEFEGCDQSSPNCVVVGDAGDHFTYDAINNAFQVLLSLKEPVLISMGKGKYYREGEELVLDLGAYTTALEYACDMEAEVIGKPSPQFFQSALSDMGIEAKEAVMVGDDINSDVGAAQKCGMQGVLVRTGKFRPCDETNELVKPDAIFDNLAQFVEHLSSSSN